MGRDVFPSDAAMEVCDVMGAVVDDVTVEVPWVAPVVVSWSMGEVATVLCEEDDRAADEDACKEPQ